MILFVKKNITTPCIVALLICAFSTQSYGDNITIAEQVKLDPFTMAKFYVTNLNGTYKGENIEDPDKLGAKDFSSWILGMEKPIYKNYLSYGFEFGAFGRVIEGISATLAAKLSAPISLGALGDIALITRGNFGLSCLTGSQLKNLPKRRLGTIISWSVGVEYYPVEWVGLAVEMRTNIYNYGKQYFSDEELKNFSREEDLASYHSRDSRLNDIPFDPRPKGWDKPVSLQLDNLISISLRITF